MSVSQVDPWIENRTFDEINVGDAASLARTLSRKDIELFAVMSGDVNPAHLDEAFARGEMFREVIAHGMWGGALISAVLGTELPGPGTVYLSQSLRFMRPVKIGDTLTVTVTAQEKNEAKHRITFDCQCVNQSGQTVISGLAEVVAPNVKIKRPRVQLPEVRLIDKHARYNELLAKASTAQPVVAAIAHPCDLASLQAAIEAARAGLIEPVLIGPALRIRKIADDAGLDLSQFRLVATTHSHESAEKAVAMCREGAARLIVQGSLSESELLGAVKSIGSGMHTGRQLSHLYVMDVPTAPQLLLITDAGLNVEPDLIAKRDIVQNAIDFAKNLGIECPKVAILAAMEKVRADLRSTIDAAALCKMAERGQISGGVIDGPLSFDNAVSGHAASKANIVSEVAGAADILVVPNLEAGNMLAHQLIYLADAQPAAVVLGARVPIALAGPLDYALCRLAACAVAVLSAGIEAIPPHR